MDLASKKRKADENGASSPSPPTLTLEDARKILSPFTHDQLLDIVTQSLTTDPSSPLLPSIRSIADRDPTQRKLFIRGLGWETTTDSLRSLFSSFGDLEEAVVISDKSTGKSKGYGFITFRHIDGAILALKDPSKKIDGRMTVTQLACLGNTGAPPIPPSSIPSADVSHRKIYVGNVPPDMPSDRLLALFSSYGEIEEGPLGFDKQTGKFRGYALFVYKTVESAKAAVEEPTKTIDGHHLLCKFANDGKKGKPVVATAPAPIENKPAEPQPGLNLGGFNSSQFGGPGTGISSFGGYASGGHHHHLTTPSSIGAGLSSVGSQLPPSSLGGPGVGGYGGGLGGPYGGAPQYSGPGSAAAAYGGLGLGSSLYRMPPSSVGMGSGGYGESGPYSLGSAGGYSAQHHPQVGSPPGARVPPSMYPGLPPFY